MKALLLILKKYASISLLALVHSYQSSAQTMEWRLAEPVYSNIDPDGFGPAKGSVSFKLQIRAVSDSAPNITAISVGWSYQSDKHIIPSIPACFIVPKPANVTLSPEFIFAGYDITISNQCLSYGTPRMVDSHKFDKLTVILLEGNPITIKKEWTNIFKTTLWTMQGGCPNTGYVIIHSSDYGSPMPLGTYAVATGPPIQSYPVNSLTYTTPLKLCNMPDSSSITNNSSIVPDTLRTYNLNLYPTIVKDVANLKITSMLTQTLSFQIIDIHGNVMQQFQKQIVKGSNTLSFQITKSLNPGLYLLIANNGRERTVHKFIKQ